MADDVTTLSNPWWFPISLWVNVKVPSLPYRAPCVLASLLHLRSHITLLFPFLLQPYRPLIVFQPTQELLRLLFPLQEMLLPHISLWPIPSPSSISAQISSLNRRNLRMIFKSTAISLACPVPLTLLSLYRLIFTKYVIIYIYVFFYLSLL